MTKGAVAYTMKFKPLVLKALVTDCAISQAELARALGISRPAMNLLINRGYEPIRYEKFRQALEAVLKKIPAVSKWLDANGYDLADIWTLLGEEKRNHKPADHGKRVSRSMRLRPVIVPGDPYLLNIKTEVEMFTSETLRHFKIFRNPFIDDVQKESDIYMSDEHRYIEAAMLDAARHGGFLAVVGEVGSGKSVMRRRVIEQLRKDNDILVIYPQLIDKTRLTAASICEAIIMDISDQKPKIRLEQKSRQVGQLLLDRSKSGYRACLIIEEAHDLNTQTLKYLKRFHEIEDGHKKLLGIILVGQPELKHMFNEAQHVEMREVIRRVQVAEIRGLNGHLKDYLTLKFKRLNMKVDDIFDDKSLAALSKRLSTQDRNNKVISHAYPLMVNNMAIRAMNLACDMGEKRVTEEVVNAI